MSAAPARPPGVVDSRLERLYTQIEELESRLHDAELQQGRLGRLEQDLLDASGRRIHDFERRLEHEWLALRQLHEEQLTAVEQRTVAIADQCLIILRETLAHLRRATAAGPIHTAGTVRRDRRLWPPRSTLTLLLVLAVGIGLAGLIAGTFWRLSGDIREAQSRAAAAERRATELQRSVERQTRESAETVQRLTADALASATRAERVTNVLAAPDLRAYPMHGQRAAAAAHGQALFSPSRGVAVTTSRLPAVASNQAYQVWLVTTRGAISLGFVSPDSRGTVSAAFETPLELSGNVVRFMLSVEPIGGSTQPTGPTALTS